MSLWLMRDRVGLCAMLLLTWVFLLAACASPDVAHSRAPIDQERSADRLGALTEAEARALDAFESEYGQVTSTYAEGSATVAEWRTLELNNTQGLAVGSEEDTKIVFAVFIRGNFVKYGPMHPTLGQIKVSYDAGRIVYDEAGQILVAQLWVAADAKEPFASGAPAFARELDSD